MTLKDLCSLLLRLTGLVFMAYAALTAVTWLAYLLPFSIYVDGEESGGTDLLDFSVT